MDNNYENLAQFVMNEVPKIAEITDRKNQIPEEFLERMKKIGLFNLKEFGIRKIFELVNIAARSSPAIANLLLSNLAYISHSKLREKKYEGSIFSFSVTESGGGTDIKSNLHTVANDREDGSAIITGEKVFSSIAVYASHYIVLANGSKGPTLYLVERQEGIDITPMDITGFRGSGIGTVRYKDVRGEPLGVPGKGISEVLQAINLGRIGYGIIAQGISIGAMDHIIKSVNKQIFGNKLLEFQSVKWMFAEIEIKRRLLEALVNVTIEQIENGKIPDALDSSIIKVFSGELAQRAAWISTQLSGGKGFITAGITDRFTRDARVLDIGEGSREVLLDFIGGSTISKYQIGSGSSSK